jgi:hypothetical protein
MEKWYLIEIIFQNWYASLKNLGPLVGFFLPKGLPVELAIPIAPLQLLESHK